MKKILLTLALAGVIAPLFAQTAPPAGGIDPDVERSRLRQERTAVDGAFARERAACFKQFVVESCLADSRSKRRTALDDIKRQEAILNEAERKRRAGASLDRLEQRQSQQRAAEGAAARERAVQAQKDRDQRAADHAASRAGLAAEAAAKRRQFDDKQRANAAQRSKEAERRVQAPAEAQRYDEKVRKAQAHQADLERRNAARTKPRSNPLPPPP